MSAPPTQWYKLDVTWRLSLWHDNCEQKILSCEQWALLCHIAKYKWICDPFSFLTQRKSCCDCWHRRIYGMMHLKHSTIQKSEKNTIAFSKSISVYVDDLVHVPNGPRWQWYIRCQNCVSWPLEKLIFYVCSKNFKNHCEAILHEKLNSSIFSRCWDMMKLIRLIEQSHKSHNAPIPYPTIHHLE